MFPLKSLVSFSAQSGSWIAGSPEQNGEPHSRCEAATPNIQPDTQKREGCPRFACVF